MRLSKLLNIVFPDMCPLCSERQPEDGKPICSTCFSDLSIIHGRTCTKCGGPLLTEHARCRECTDSPRVWWQSAVSAFCFDGLSREAVHRFKYHGDVSLIPFLSDACISAWNERCPDKTVDCIVPVPLHWLRKLRRGYNQSEMICTEISQALSAPMIRAVKRVRWTPPQAQLSKSKRQNNLKNAFLVSNQERIRGKSLLLVDDVMTTGSTLNECSRQLVKAGAAEVNILTIARRL
ncbi:hypothetical protein BVX99_03345 [bacterium F16]|nr:hypothetical protein BVX99_03345 [bacterium F16]